MTDEEWAKFQQGRQAITGGDGSSGGGFFTDVGHVARGAVKGALSNVTGAAEVLGNVTGAEGVLSQVPGVSRAAKGVKDWVNDRSGEDAWESAGRFGGEWGSLMIPGLDLGIGAKIGGRAAEALMQNPAAVKYLNNYAMKYGPQGAADLMNDVLDWGEKLGTGSATGAEAGAVKDPEHPLEGAAIGGTVGAAAPVARAGVGAAARAIPPWAKTAGTLAGGVALEEGLRHGRYVPGAFYAAHAMPSALAGVAATAAGYPGLAGGAASQMFGSGDDQGQ